MSRPEDQTQAYTQEQKIKALEVLSKKAKDPKQFATTFNALDDAGKKEFYDKAYSTFEELKPAQTKEPKEKSFLQDIGEKAVALPYKAAESASFGGTTPLLAGFRTAKGELNEIIGGPEIPIGQRYSQSKKDIQASSKAMEAEQPFVSTVGNIAGYLPGLGVKALSKAAQKFLFPIAKKTPRLLDIGSRMFGEGVQGAIQEKGQKEIGQGEDQAAREFLLNTITGGVASQTGRVLKKSKDAIGSASKGILSSMQGLSKESIDTYAKNPEQVNKAIQDMVAMDYVPKFLEDTGTKMKDFVTSRTKLIDDIISKNSYKNISTTPILERIVEQTNGLKVGGPAKASIGRMQTLFDDIDKLDTMTASELNTVKKQIQEELQGYYQKTGFEKDSYSEALSNVEKILRESLESVDPQIKVFNKQLSNVIDLSKTLGFGSVFDGELMKGNRAAALLSQLSNMPKQDQLKAARELDQIIGTDILEAHSIFKAAKEFGDASGQDFLSRFKTGRGMIAPILGAIMGGPMGATAGAILQSPASARPLIRIGTTADKYAEGLSKVLQEKPASRLIKGSVIQKEKK